MSGVVTKCEKEIEIDKLMILIGSLLLEIMDKLVYLPFNNLPLDVFMYQERTETMYSK